MKIKGHTTIELRDVVTGEVKRYDDDNMLTSAVEQMVNFAAKHSLGTNSLDIYSTHWANLLGGLVIFDTALTESVDTVYPPAGVKPVGYGIQGDTNSYTNESSWGIYNTQESDTSQTDTKKMVWDFATSHANGTIACVCLTHKNNGLFGFGVNSYFNTSRANLENIIVGTIITQSRKGKQGLNTANYGIVGSQLSLNDGSYVDFCIDSENDVKYMLKVCQDGISIIKHNLYPENFDFFRSSAYYQSFEEETYAETFSGSHFYHFYNPDEKMLYFWTLTWDAGTQINSSVTITIHRFDLENKILTKSWKSASLTTRPYTGIVVTNNGVYYLSYDSSFCIKKYSFASDTNDILWSGASYTIETYGAYGGKPYIVNGLIYINNVIRYNTSGDSYAIIVDTSNDSVRYTNLQGDAYYYNYDSRYQKVPPIDNTQIVWGSRLNAGDVFGNGRHLNLQGSGNTASNYGNMSSPVHYLGTINNLATPVIKTAQQTMKLTYTITKEEE